jgi:hypothetical protein
VSLLVAKALWGTGWFLVEVAIPTALGLGLAGYIATRAAQGWVRSWTRP